MTIECAARAKEGPGPRLRWAGRGSTVVFEWAGCAQNYKIAIAKLCVRSGETSKEGPPHTGDSLLTEPYRIAHITHRRPRFSRNTEHGTIVAFLVESIQRELQKNLDLSSLHEGHEGTLASPKPGLINQTAKSLSAGFYRPACARYNSPLA